MDFDKLFEECATAGESGGDQAPEHVLHVVNGQEEKTLEERLELRKELNSHLFEAIDNKRLTEELKDEDSDINTVRYKLQKFTNGGTPYIDENGTAQTDGEKGGPSAYEAWRAGINNEKRDKRLKLEKEEKESPFASPKHTQSSGKQLDGQVDDFLNFWVDKYGEK